MKNKKLAIVAVVGNSLVKDERRKSHQHQYISRPPGLKALVNTPGIEEWFTRGTNRWNQERDLFPVIMRAAGDFIMEREARQAIRGHTKSIRMHGSFISSGMDAM